MQFGEGAGADDFVGAEDGFDRRMGRDEIRRNKAALFDVERVGNADPGRGR